MDPKGTANTKIANNSVNSNQLVQKKRFVLTEFDSGEPDIDIESIRILTDPTVTYERWSKPIDEGTSARFTGFAPDPPYE